MAETAPSDCRQSYDLQGVARDYQHFVTLNRHRRYATFTMRRQVESGISDALGAI
jgi:hypothetical protein